MKYQVVDLLHPHLSQVDYILKQEFKLRHGSILDYVSINDSNPLEYYLPAILVLLFGHDKQETLKTTIEMSCVAQFIYLGTMVHSKVENDHEEENTQFPILIGDYLYGKFFVTLCQANCLEFLAPLSQVIRSIHEVGVEEGQISYSNIGKTKMLELFEKKWGEFFGLSCKIGTTINKKTYEQREYAYQVGKALGEFYGASTSRFKNNDWIEETRGKVIALIKGLPDNYTKQGLINIIEEIFANTNNRSCEKSFLVG